MVIPGTELGGMKRRRDNPRSAAGVVIGKAGDYDEFEIGDRVASMGGCYALHATYAYVLHNLCAMIPDNIKCVATASIHLDTTALHAVQRRRRCRVECGTA